MMFLLMIFKIYDFISVQFSNPHAVNTMYFWDNPKKSLFEIKRTLKKEEYL